MTRGLKIGLTGGMGCGKSTLGRILTTYGFHRIDADDIVRELLERDTGVQQEVFQKWGEIVRNPQGSVDRKRLADIVFQNREELDYLEQLLHPKVGDAWRKTVENQPNFHWIIEIPLLFEKKLESLFDYVIAIYVSEEEQMRRLLHKGFSKETISARLERQWSIATKAELADFVFLNQGRESFLNEQADYLARILIN